MKDTDFVATDGWFQRWKKRENIVYKRVHGEQKDADTTEAGAWLEVEWPKTIADNSPDVYNADETSLFYRALPEHTYLFKNKTVRGCSVERSGDCALLRKHVRYEAKAFSDRKKSQVALHQRHKKLPAKSYANANAWMTSVIFKEWLVKWDNQLTKNIILLVDNCTAHAVNLTLKHTKLIFLLANTTSLLQPLDLRIIRFSKSSLQTRNAC